MALKRKNSSSALVCDFDQSTPSKSSTIAADKYLRLLKTTFEKVLLYFCDWSGSSDQATAPIYERRAEDHISLRSIDSSLEDHDLQDPPFSSLEVLPPEDQQAQTPPAPSYKRKHSESDLKHASERNDCQERKKRRKSSFEKLPSLDSSSSQGQKVDDQTFAAIGERQAEDETKQTSFIIGQKRKRCSLSDQMYDSHYSTPPTSSTSAAENHLPIGAGEEREMTMRKKRRTKSHEKLLSLKSTERSSSSDQAMIYERQVEDGISLQSISWSEEDLEESLSSDLEDFPPADHQNPSASASAHNSRVDLTTEDDILSRYEIGKRLGKGGFGCVYEGKRLEDGLEVAVKIARKPRNMKYISVPGHPAPIPLEVGLLLLVNKESRVPEIIKLLDWQDQPKRYIMVLEHPSPCKDLWDYTMLQGGFLSEDTARSIMAQATKAAHMCCQRGVFHRDIKMENLLVNMETLEVKLIDFGCGDLLRDSGYKHFCGTSEFCPPEYYVDHKYHGKPTTVWSLGILLFLLVCGSFPEPKDTELIDDGIWFKDELSNECCHLIRSLLNESPSQRIDLGEILSHEWFKVTKQ